MTLTAKTAAAIEPPKNAKFGDLNSEFVKRLTRLLALLTHGGIPFVFNEGMRTTERQQWLYGQGRPNAKPYGRLGERVTKADGVKTLSNHQEHQFGEGGRAADCYPCDPKTGKIIWPPPKDSDPIWTRYAELARECGLRPGADFGDLPHVEMPKGRSDSLHFSVDTDRVPRVRILHGLAGEGSPAMASSTPAPAQMPTEQLCARARQLAEDEEPTVVAPVLLAMAERLEAVERVLPYVQHSPRCNRRSMRTLTGFWDGECDCGLSKPAPTLTPNAERG